MMWIKSIGQIVPRRMMASSSSSSGKGPKTPAEVWIDEQLRSKEALEKQALTKEITADPNDDPFSGQTKVNYNPDGVGFKQSSHSRDTFFNPLLSPPPRSPKTPEDFANPSRLGHWVSLGYDYTSPLRDKYYFHEFIAIVMFGVCWGAWAYYYSPDLRNKEWARREAFLRTAKREALGIPLIDRDLIDPKRMILPAEEELEGFKVNM